jgi:hypothetical protein
MPVRNAFEDLVAEARLRESAGERHRRHDAFATEAKTA